jgi:hypothetical protein
MLRSSSSSPPLGLRVDGFCRSVAVGVRRVLARELLRFELDPFEPLREEPLFEELPFDEPLFARDLRSAMAGSPPLQAVVCVLARIPARIRQLTRRILHCSVFRRQEEPPWRD